MKRIAFFCIPAHGHTNPMLPVAKALVQRGDSVRFYSFEQFGEKIKRTGAEFVACDRFLPELGEREFAKLNEVSTTEMSIQDIRTTFNMDDFLSAEFAEFKPDVVFSDSVCFWGKLNAWKYDVPLVVSTSTFAFNQLSSSYMKHSAKEMCDLIFGLPRVSREVKKLKANGYKVKGVMQLVQSDNSTDSVVYASRGFQPYVESFSDHYAFVGPSVFSSAQPDKSAARPLVYISLGTVINDRPGFYRACIDALKSLDVDVVISCGNAVAPESLGQLPDNVKVYPYVDQLDVLSRASAFISHCGMNSVSESLYMAAPLVLYPQTAEQCAVAKRVTELDAGIMLSDDSEDGIRAAVTELLQNTKYAAAAQRCSREFRACSGPEGAAEFIENAPHQSTGVDLMKELNKANVRNKVIFQLIKIAVAILLGTTVGWGVGIAFGVLSGVFADPLLKPLQKKTYQRLLKKYSIQQ